jgi:hypothetical protein
VLNAAEKKRLRLLQTRIDAAQMSGAAFELTPDDDAFLNLVALKSAKQNIRKKALGGKTLTTREVAMLAESVEPEEAAPEAGVMFVQNWNELADAIPIDRRTLQNFRDDHADLVAQNKAKLFRSDGRKNVPAWRSLIAECGVRGRGANNANVNSEDVRALELAERRYKLDKAIFDLDKAKQIQMPVADFEAALGAALVQFRSSINSLPGRGTGKILNRARTAVLNMLRGALTERQFEAVDRAMSNAKLASVEYSDIEDVLQEEVNLVLRSLESCDYLAVREDE